MLQRALMITAIAIFASARALAVYEITTAQTASQSRVALSVTGD